MTYLRRFLKKETAVEDAPSVQTVCGTFLLLLLLCFEGKRRAGAIVYAKAVSSVVSAAFSTQICDVNIVVVVKSRINVL